MQRQSGSRTALFLEVEQGHAHWFPLSRDCRIREVDVPQKKYIKLLNAAPLFAIMSQHTFTFENCGHTIGNALKSSIDDGAIFVSYKVPHPLSKNVEITVEANNEDAAWGNSAQGIITKGERSNRLCLDCNIAFKLKSMIKLRTKK